MRKPPSQQTQLGRMFSLHAALLIQRAENAHEKTEPSRTAVSKSGTRCGACVGLHGATAPNSHRARPAQIGAARTAGRRQLAAPWQPALGMNSHHQKKPGSWMGRKPALTRFSRRQASSLGSHTCRGRVQGCIHDTMLLCLRDDAACAGARCVTAGSLTALLGHRTR